MKEFKRPAIIEIINFTKSIIVFIGIALLLRASVVEAFKIPSSSMEPTLQIGDHILVNKLSYGLRAPLVSTTLVQFWEPKREDIVVFTHKDDPKTKEVDESDTNIIKRVVGLPGDTVMVRGTKVYINNQLYSEDERYARWRQGGVKNFGPVKVPEGKVMLLGDNRDYSKDSRYWSDPFLEIERIKGRAFIIYWSSTFLFNRIFNIIH